MNKTDRYTTINCQAVPVGYVLKCDTVDVWEAEVLFATDWQVNT